MSPDKCIIWFPNYKALIFCIISVRYVIGVKGHERAPAKGNYRYGYNNWLEMTIRKKSVISGYNIVLNLYRNVDYAFYCLAFISRPNMDDFNYSYSCKSRTLSQQDKKAWKSVEKRALKVSKGAKIRNGYNQVPHLTQDTNGKVTNSELDTTNESQEVSPFPAGDHKAHINRRAQRHSKHL